MRNIPLVFLGVIFTSIASFIAFHADVRVVSAAMAAIAVVSGIIESVHISARKKLDEILSIKTLLGPELRYAGKKVERWKSLFDTHRTLSWMLKILIAASATALPFIQNELVSNGLEIVSVSMVAGLMALFVQSHNYHQHIDQFLDRKTIESRNLMAGVDAAGKIRGKDEKSSKSNGGASKTPLPKYGYEKIILKA